MRKTLTILSLLGLVLSLVLWAVSYKGFAGSILNGAIGVFVYHGDFQANGSVPLQEEAYGSYDDEWSWGVVSIEFGNRGFWARLVQHTFPSPSFGYDKALGLWEIRVPFWLTALISLLPAGLLGCRARSRRRRKLGLCLSCGYDLRASKDRCPECGAGFEEKVQQP